MIPLPQALLSKPIAHRALHNKGAGRPENSLDAIEAAIEQGYGIEIDLQLSKDGQAMVFHDYDLKRLTGHNGPLCQKTAKDLGRIPLIGGTQGIPTLRQVLDMVAGQVPLLIEIKDQDLRLGPNIGALEKATAEDLKGYAGAVAVMSFNPHSVIAMSRLAPTVPRGLTTCNFDDFDWPLVPAERRIHLAEIPHFSEAGASFISHQRDQLDSPAVAALKAKGTPVLCWTVKSKQQEAEARKIADNITFEGYTPS